MKAANVSAVAIGLTFAVITYASAQSGSGQQPIAQLASHLAYETCPQLLRGDASLERNPNLQALGFPATARRRASAIGEAAVIGQTRADGDITLANVGRTVCQVNVLGSSANEASTSLRSRIGNLGMNFQADPTRSIAHPTADMRAETFIARPSSTRVVMVQFTSGTVRGTPMAGFQMVIQDQ